MKKTNQKQKGAGLAEIIIAINIIVIALFSLIFLAQYNLKFQEQNKSKIEAINLASEAIEAARSFRDENWTNLDSLLLETPYYPIISSSKWELASTDPGPINGVYSRWIIIERVYRDASDNISQSGAEDKQTKKIIAYVQWNDRDKTKQINLNTYLTNWSD